MTPDTNIEKPKRGRGRPKKYFTDEDRKKGDKGYLKKCMENPFHCSVSDRMYHMASKSKYLKSKNHIRNFEKNVGDLYSLIIYALNWLKEFSIYHILYSIYNKIL